VDGDVKLKENKGFGSSFFGASSSAGFDVSESVDDFSVDSFGRTRRKSESKSNPMMRV